MTLSPESFSLIVRDGVQLYGEEWLPENPKGIITIVHGLSEHVGRYHHVASFFAEKGLAVYLFDLRGHGQSEGKRGHTPSHERMLDDIEEVLMYARSEYNDLPLFLMGHSLGGNLVANYTLTKTVSELKGAIISSPWLEIIQEVSAIELKLLKWINKIFPSFSQSNRLKIEWLSNDPEILRDYKEDPLVHDRISARLFLEFYEAGQKTLRDAHQIKLTSYLYHGDDDMITSAEASKTFAQKAGDLVNFKSYSETKHEPHNDVKKEEVLNDVCQWIEKLL